MKHQRSLRPEPAPKKHQVLLWMSRGRPGMFRLTTLALATGMFLATLTDCKKEPPPGTGGNKVSFGVTTADSTDYDIIWVSTTISSLGSQQAGQHGHCWGTDANPDVQGNHTTLGPLTATGTFTDQLTGLEPGTLFFIRPYVSAPGGVIYGAQVVDSTTTSGRPSVSSPIVSELKHNGGKLTATVLEERGSPVTRRGFCWSKSGIPTLSSCEGSTANGTGLGSFSTTLTQLSGGTWYIVASYASNGYGTDYSDTVVFKTILVTPPTVVTSEPGSMTASTAKCGGTVTGTGNGTVSYRGICWAAFPNPTLLNCGPNKMALGSGAGSYTGTITGLTASTLYYVQAYATNEAGTAYGGSRSFSTDYDCNYIFGVVHSPTGGVAPVNKNVTYGTVNNIPGEPSKCWITRNLGADIQATTVNDNREAAAGWYWQFNRKKGYKHDGVNLTPTWTSTPINESLNWQNNEDPCAIELGSPWRIPTYSEWYNVDNTGGWVDWNDAWYSGLKLHASGWLDFNTGSLLHRGSHGIFWSSQQNSSTDGWNLYLQSSSSNMWHNLKADGFSIRCLRD